MGNLGRRIQDLEEQLTAESAREPSEVFVQLRAILNELAALKSSCAPGLRGGVAIEPEHIPRKILGPGYTSEDLWRLAVSRVVEAGKAPAERTEAYVGLLCKTWGRGGKDPGAVVEWERHGA